MPSSILLADQCYLEYRDSQGVKINVLNHPDLQKCPHILSGIFKNCPGSFEINGEMKDFKCAADYFSQMMSSANIEIRIYWVSKCPDLYTPELGECCVEIRSAYSIYDNTEQLFKA